MTGRGVATDVVEASARAYLAAGEPRPAGEARPPRDQRGHAVTDRSLRIGVIRGDGTGRRWSPRASRCSTPSGTFDVTLVEFDLGADRYLRTGEVLPDEELARLARWTRSSSGAVGDPRVRPGILERDLLLKIRFELDQWVNLRPVVRYPGVATLVPSHSEDDVNFVVVRENSEGLYSGAGGFHRKGTAHEVAVQESINTRHGVERIVRYAFELAASPERRRQAHARAQDQRADLRGRSVPAGGRRARRASSRGSRPTTCTSTPPASSSWTRPRGSTSS